MFRKFLKVSLYTLLFALVLSAVSTTLYAAPPGTAYTPGETLDPSCSPGGTNCTVDYPVGGNGGNIQFNDYSNFGGESSFVYATSTGNVGIGTSSPYAKLSVTGEVVANNFTATSTSATSTLPNLSITNLLFGSDYITDITGSGLSIVNGALTSSGGSSDHTFPFTFQDNVNSTSTTLGFYNGFLSTASTTLTATTTFTSRVYQKGLGGSTFFGDQAGENDDLTNNFNTAFGYQSLYSNTAGNKNTASGYGTLYSNTTGSQNTASGLQSLYSNTTGSNNTASGQLSLYSNTTGSQNTASGRHALYLNTTGDGNTASGHGALYSNTIGNNNVANGQESLFYNTSATSSTAIGFQAGYGVSGSTYSQNNVFLGYKSGWANTTGDNNVLLGYQSGDNISSGDNNLIIGYDIDAQSATASNQLSIGNLIFSEGIDGTGTSLSSGNLGIGTTSPGSKLSVLGNAFISGTTTASALSLKGQGTGIEFSDGTIQTTAASGGGSNDHAYPFSGTNNGTSTLVSLTAGVNVGTSTNPSSGVAYFDGAVAVNSSNGSIVFGDTSGNSRGGGSLDLQSGRSADSQVASGASSAAVGNRNTASASFTSAFGYSNTASTGSANSAFGYGNTASGIAEAAAFGIGNTASGNSDSSAFGSSNTASGNNSSAFGAQNTASGSSSVSFGILNTASGSSSIAVGNGSDAIASGSSVFGSTITNYLANTTQIGPSEVGKITIDSSGRLGLASTSPTYKLHVPGDAYFSSYVDASYFVATSTTATSTFSGSIVGNPTGVTNRDFVFGSAQTGDSGNASHDSRLFFDKSKAAFRAGLVQSTQWDDSNVGSYSTAFGINNTASGGRSTAFGDSNIASGGYATVFGREFEVSGTYSFGIALDDQNSAELSQNNTFAVVGGNVGFGTLTPSYNLEVEGVGRFSSLLDAANFTATSTTATSTFRGGLLVGTSTSPADAGQFVLDGYATLTSSNGAVVIGDTTGAVRGAGAIDVQNSRTSTAQVASGVQAATFGTQNTASGNYSGAFGYFNTASGEKSYAIGANISNTIANSVQIGPANDAKIIIDSNGYLGIATTTPTAELSVDGTIFSSDLYGGNTTLEVDANGNIIRTPSDRRLKNEITPLTGSLEKVLQLQGVSYGWKDPEKFGNEREIGLIAQEVEEIVPEVVRSGGEYKSLKYQNLVAILIEAIKELNTKVDNLAANAGNTISNWKNLVVDTLKVGSPNKPSGIVLYDEKTGDPFCLYISYGNPETKPGECDDLSVEEDSEPEVIIVEEKEEDSNGTTTPEDIVPEEEKEVGTTAPDEIVEEEETVEDTEPVEEEVVEEEEVSEPEEEPEVVEEEAPATEEDSSTEE